MTFIRIKTVSQIPPPLFDWNEIVKTIIYVIGVAFGAVKGMSFWFRNKEKERQAKEQEKTEFIEKIAETAVDKTLQKVFNDVNNSFVSVNKNIDILFKYREEDRKHWDARFDSVMNKVGK